MTTEVSSEMKCHGCQNSISATEADYLYQCKPCNLNYCDTCFFAGSTSCPKKHQIRLSGGKLVPNIVPFPPTPSNSSRTTKPPYDITADPSVSNYDAIKSYIQTQNSKENPNLKWENIAGLEVAKDKLRQMVVLPAKFPQFCSIRRRNRREVLLYGVQGTGKSSLVEACATEAGCEIYDFSCHDVLGSWGGESVSYIKILFDLARKCAKHGTACLIYIKDIDMLGNDQIEYSHDMKTELFVQMSGHDHDGNDDGVFVVAATNEKPWLLPTTIRRRFTTRIHTSLPGAGARIEILKLMTTEAGGRCDFSDEEWVDLGAKTRGMSGLDIRRVAEAAIKRVEIKVVAVGKLDDTGVLVGEEEDVSSVKSHSPEIVLRDFVKSLEELTTAERMSQDDKKRYTEWTKEWGHEGASDT